MSVFEGNLLTGRFHQMAYVTNDFDRAIAEFGRKAGITRFHQMRDADFAILPGKQAKAHLALATAGGIQVEVIAPAGGHDEVYRQMFSGDGYQLYYHHEAHVLESIEQLRAVKENARRQGFPIPVDYEDPRWSFFYADTRSFVGHFTEFLHFSAEAIRFLDAVVPVN